MWGSHSHMVTLWVMIMGLCIFHFAGIIKYPEDNTIIVASFVVSIIGYLRERHLKTHGFEDN